MRSIGRSGVGVLLGMAAALFSVAAAEPPIRIMRDIAYRAELVCEATTLDVYAAFDAHDCPVMIYVHGGGWGGGDKQNVNSKPQFFVENGYVFVSVNYRLTPDVVFPTHAEDVGAAIRWVYDQISAYGGAPDRICLMGHSAGAHLVALVSTDPRYLDGVGLGLWAIRAVISLDTQAYDLRALAADSGGRLPELYAATFSQNPDAWTDASPMSHVVSGNDIPSMLIAVSRGVRAKPNRHRVTQGRRFAEVLRDAGVETDLMVSLSQSHSDINQQFGEPDDRVSTHALEFLGSSPPTSMRMLRDLVYAKTERSLLTLDLYLPHPLPEGRLPLVVWIHGGGWRSGSKGRTRAPETLGTGYAVASIDYRLTQEATFPAQIHDCKAAVRWLRAHAEEYGFDPDRIGAWGSSAGGHLAALLGTSGGVETLEGSVGEHLNESSRVQAVCNFFGPTDLLTLLDQPSLLDHASPASPESLLLGGPAAENEALALLGSPISFVDRSDPPFFIAHGDEDPTVPIGQSLDFHSALLAEGVTSELQIVEGAKHGGFPEEIYEEVKRFFDEQL